MFFSGHSCPGGYAAVFPDGSIEVGWHMELSCSENDMGWRKFNSEEQPALGQLLDLQELPYCGKSVPAALIKPIYWNTALLTLPPLSVQFLIEQHKELSSFCFEIKKNILFIITKIFYCHLKIYSKFKLCCSSFPSFSLKAKNLYSVSFLQNLVCSVQPLGMVLILP